MSRSCKRKNDYVAIPVALENILLHALAHLISVAHLGFSEIQWLRWGLKLHNPLRILFNFYEALCKI